MDEDKPYDDINVTPMLDLSYVLLIIFILLTTAAAQSVRVDLPQSSQAEPVEEPRTVMITVNNEGRFFMNTIPVSLEELESRLSAELARTSDLPVIIRGDNATQYRSIMEALDVVGRVGIHQVGLATAPRQ